MNIKTFLTMFLLLFFVTACPSDKGSDSPEPTPVEEPTPLPDPNDPSPPPSLPDGTPPISEPDPSQEPAPTPAPVPPTSEVPPDRADTFQFKIVFGGSSSYNTATRRAKYMKAVAVCDKVVASKSFKDRIFAHEYGSNDFAHMSTDPFKTDDLIYDHILDGNEKRKPEKDNEADMEVRFYYANNSTVGYTYPTVDYIMVNTKFFDGYALNSVCANLVHEWLHKMGYGHDSSRTARRPYSIPYGIGGIAGSVGKQFL